MGAGDAAGALPRPDLYVVARFLERLRRMNAPPTKSRLQLAVRLNWDLFRRYLSFLESRAFVALEPGPDEQEVVRLTPKGVEAHQRIMEWIRDVLGDVHF